MQEGTIVNTRVNVGDQVSHGAILFEVETDKATLEIESPAAGCVKAILVEDGQTVPVNGLILILGEPDQAVDVSAYKHPHPAAETTAEHVDDTRQTDASLDAMTPQRHGPTAALAQDVTDEVSPAYSFGQRIPLNRLQRIVAEKMLWSKQNIPCFYLNIRADMTKLVALRAKLNKTAPVKLSINDFLLRGLAIGMKHYPIMTGQLDGEHIQLARSLDFGLAIATDDGLIAPIVRDCGSKSVYDIGAYCTDLIARTRSGKLSLDDLEGGCITVSNLGGLGIESFIPIVVPGQTSILGVGTITDTVVPADGNLLVRKMMNLTLSVDHKVVNGAEAAQFLDYVKKHLEHPDTLV